MFTFFSPSSTAISIYWNGTEVPPCAPAGGDQLTLGTFTLLSLPGARQPLRAHRLRHLRHFPTRERGACAFDTWVGKNQNQNHARAGRLSARMRVVTRGDAGTRTCSSSSEKTGRTGVPAGGGLQGGRSPRVARVGQEKSCLWQWPFSIKI